MWAVALVAVHAPSPASAQTLPAALGAVGGLVVGTYTTLGIYVAEARGGRYLYSADDAISLRLENLPVLAGPVAGLIVGLQDSERLETAGIWGGVGLVSGSALGAPIGRALWGSGEGTWSGAIIGGAAGLVIGVVVGALQDPGLDALDAQGSATVPIGVSIRIR